MVVLSLQAPAVPQMIAGGVMGSPVMQGGASPSGAMDQQQQQGCPNSVLRVIIENMLYPISIEVLDQVIINITSVATCACAIGPFPLFR